MNLFGTNHPFFKPLWIRLVVVAIASGWAAFEFWNGSYFWGMIFLGFAGVSVYGFFIDFHPDEPTRK